MNFEFDGFQSAAFCLVFQLAAAGLSLGFCCKKKKPEQASGSGVDSAKPPSSASTSKPETAGKKPVPSSEKSVMKPSSWKQIKEDPDLVSKDDYRMKTSESVMSKLGKKDEKKEGEAKTDRDKKKEDEKPKQGGKNGDKEPEKPSRKEKDKEEASKKPAVWSGKEKKVEKTKEECAPKKSDFAKPDILVGPNIFAGHNPNQKERKFGFFSRISRHRREEPKFTMKRAFFGSVFVVGLCS
ncbi:hypothetical protein L596_008663 [Steinernema carpocapsae]|uniref:Uncharacterized protein n=1 Tax=Steinernema carpocapsae TaxID=34508 RepID=A0A4U5PEA4_STECR|nr:hypothetical protein L596_008663 [Steinernema carpocapsae]